MKTPDTGIQETKTSFEENPIDISVLHQLTAAGVDTYKGVHRELEFRVGIELEFELSSPSVFRRVYLESAPTENTGENVVDSVFNTETIDGEDGDYKEVVEEFKNYAKGFIERLKPTNEREELVQKEWIKQLPKFGPIEVFNFLLYEEFSTPMLGVPSLPDDATLSEIDAHTAEGGWLEWRFGNGLLQSGYYDNEHTPEIRIAPCAPEEALERLAIIKARMKELGEQLGILVRADSRFEHINISVFDVKPDGTAVSIIGNKGEKVTDTIDVVTGIIQGYQDGASLYPQLLEKQDPKQQEYDHLGVGPTRKNIRVLDGRLELRSHFLDTTQGVAWMMAGALQGIKEGAAAIGEQGYDIATYEEVHAVERTSEFVKDFDLQIQRAFEASNRLPDGTFMLRNKWRINRGERFIEQIFEDNDDAAVELANSADLIMAAVKLDNKGRPFVSAESLAAARDYLVPSRLEQVRDISPDEVDEYVEEINEKLAVVRIKTEKAVLAESSITTGADSGILDQFRGSAVLGLAFGAARSTLADKLKKAAS